MNTWGTFSYPRDFSIATRRIQTGNCLGHFVDDMGYGDPDCFNAAPKIATPNINRLAAEGMRFTDAHAPGAVCHPSRYGLLTGRYPFRTDVSVWPQNRSSKRAGSPLPRCSVSMVIGRP